MTPNDTLPPSEPLPRQVDEPSAERRRKAGDAKELREFFMHAATLLQLPPKVPAAAADAARPPAKRGRDTVAVLWRNRRVRLALLVGGAIVAVMAAMRSSMASVPLPEAAVGVWRTDARTYAKRRFELGEKTLAFQVDESGLAVARHSITHVRKSTAPEGTFFQVDYLDQPTDSVPVTFEFILTPAENPEIIFANQRKVIWKRVSNRSPDTP